MLKLAVDIVLIPSDIMMDKVIEINKSLVTDYGSDIVLNKRDCLPHISLFMGVINPEDIKAIKAELAGAAEKFSSENLEVESLSVTANFNGRKTSAFTLKKAEGIQGFHEDVAGRMQKYFSREVSAEMFFSPDSVNESSIDWVSSFPEKSSFELYWPHITLGYGEARNVELPIRFSPSKLALCHLGNHCTCRKILTSIDL